MSSLNLPSVIYLKDWVSFWLCPHILELTLSIFPHWSFLNASHSYSSLPGFLQFVCVVSWCEASSGHYPSRVTESQQKCVKDILWLTCKTPTYTEVWCLPHFLPQTYPSADSYSACNNPTPHALSQYCYLLRHPSSSYTHSFSLPHWRLPYLHFLISHFTHFNHFCILSRSLQTLNLFSTISKSYWTLQSLAPCTLQSIIQDINESHEQHKVLE